MTPSLYRLLALVCVAALARPAAAGFTVTGGSSSVAASAAFDQVSNYQSYSNNYPAATGFSFTLTETTGGSPGASALASQVASVPTSGPALTASGTATIAVDAGGNPGSASALSAITISFTLGETVGYTYFRSAAAPGSGAITTASLVQVTGSNPGTIWSDTGVFAEQSAGQLGPGDYVLSAFATLSTSAGPAGGTAAFVLNFSVAPAAGAPAAVPAPGGLALAAIGAAGLLGRAARRRAVAAGGPPGSSGPG